MSDRVCFTVDGVPVAKGRARSRIVTPKNGKPFVVHYTPPETEAYEKVISWAAKAAMGQQIPWQCSCEALVRAFIPVPASWPAKKHARCLTGELKPPSVPDIDNFAKSALDGCNGIIFHDDSFLWRLVAEKHYSDRPRLEVTITKYVPADLLNPSKGEDHGEE